MVGEKGGLANMFITLHEKRVTPPVHPSYEKTAEATVPLDIKNGRYQPHSLVLRTGQTLEIRSFEAVSIAPTFATVKNSGASVLLPANKSLELQFDKPERFPFPVTCAMHPWMSAYVAVVDHPYAVVSKPDGTFEIPNLPVGTWRFRVWHETAGYVREVRRQDETEEWKRGVVELTISPDDNDLGEIHVPAKLFED